MNNKNNDKQLDYSAIQPLIKQLCILQQTEDFFLTELNKLLKSLQLHYKNKQNIVKQLKNKLSKK